MWVFEKLTKRQNCPLCGAQASSGTILRKDHLTIIQCTQCPMAYVNFIPDLATLHAYYDADYFLGGKNFFAGLDYCDARHRSVMSGVPVTGYREIISDYNPKDRDIMEIGCSSGALLYQLKTHQPKSLVGLDFAQWPIDYGKKKYGLDLRCSTFTAEKFQAETFDLVIMIDVLEHILDPVSIVKEINYILRPGGMLFLITPNFDAFNVAKSHWVQLGSCYEHLHYFSRSSLAILAEQTSFCLKRVYTQGLPILLQQYPEGSHFVAKYFLYPQIAAKNFYQKARYGKISRLGGGNELIAFLEKTSPIKTYA